METSTSAIGPTSRNEPNPNYILKQRLGSGGYGEVWEAEVPGGLRKAVKFIYGMLDEVRAQRELKSLNRIKEVRHPFLLSIERIEVVDGRLIIVTELAQGCLKARFDECRAAGLEGIPRDELLNYLHDAADALDFIHERHGLQHLDIKPENLLILGNHVKVADFGLLKDLGESMSMVGGVTPSYSPPEAFDGRPSRHSDQYSLAIVYQEMLTGEAPFQGRTAAQLAAQQLHSPPMLAALSPSDQPIIGRALSKNPEQRFPSCRTLIDSLINSEAVTSKPSHRKSRATSGAGAASGSRVMRTEVLDQGNPSDDPETSRPLSRELLLPAEIRELPRIDLPKTEIGYRPTVFVGVGGTAGCVLSNLQRRLRARFGDVSAVPALQTLLIDTDPKDLATAMYKRGEGSIPAHSTLAIPLRAAKDYRSEAKHLLEWLSRRWLYNIPRSLQTEGMRPLGRLAFVDHSRIIQDYLTRTIEAASSDRALEESRQTTGLDFRSEPPNVFVIASLAGGTGGGVVLDLGYAVRKALSGLGLSDQAVCGILMHSTSRKAASRDLAVPCTLACLQELQHFSRPQGGYPGDPDCDLPPFYEDSPTFRHTYLVHLGNELGDREFELATDRVAEYLYQNVLTPAAPFFVQARSNEGTSAPENSLTIGRVRTMGLTVFEAPAAESPAERESAAIRPADDPSTAPEMQTARELAITEGHSQVCDPMSNVCRETEVNVEDTHELTQRSASLVDRCRDSVPQLVSCGGSRRTLVIAPREFSPPDLVKSGCDFSEASTTYVEHSQPEIVVCQEIQDVPLANVVAFLAGSRRDYLEIADRLHTRIDV